MKILLFGKTGQVATEFRKQAAVTALNREQADLANPEECASIINFSDADIIINAAAYTSVDKAEEEEHVANVINGQSPALMASAAARRNIPFIHISTDYVFDGSGSNAFSPEAPTKPLGAYGRSKLMGEIGVRAAGGPHAILRTSWVFSSHGSNFVKTMLRLGREKERLGVVADQVGGPTAAADIAKALFQMSVAFHSGKGPSGTYHFAGAPDISWAGFAREIFKQSKMAVEVEDILTSSYPTPATRPKNSRLDCSSLETCFGIERPDWRQSLSQVIQSKEVD